MYADRDAYEVSELDTCHPPVSIGLPVYNGGEFLERSIRSILEQSYTNFELLIHDNCSTDQTGEICSRIALKDKRVSYLRHCANLGAVENFRSVLITSKHDLFIWASADDWWDLDRLEILVDAITIEDVGIIGEVKRWVSNQVVSNFKPSSFGRNHRVKYFLKEEALCEKTYYMHSLMRRKFALIAFASWENDFWEDAIFCYKLLSFGALRSVKGAVVNGRIHENSTGAKDSRIYHYSWKRFFFLANPFSLIIRYLKHTPIQWLTFIVLLIPLKLSISQVHLWWRAIKRIFFRKPFLHGAIADGEEKLFRSGL